MVAVQVVLVLVQVVPVAAAEHVLAQEEVVEPEQAAEEAVLLVVEEEVELEVLTRITSKQLVMEAEMMQPGMVLRLTKAQMTMA